MRTRKKNDRHNMEKKKFDRLVAESTRRSLTESQRIDEWGKIVNAGKNLWNGIKAARNGMNLAQKGLQGSRMAKAGHKMAQGMGFGSKAAQLDVNALKRGEQLYKKLQMGVKLTPQEAKEAQTISRYIAMQRNAGNLRTISGAGEKLRMLQRNANRWRMGAGMGAAGLSAYGLAGDGSGAPGTDMAGAGTDGNYPGTDISGTDMYGTYPGTDMSGGVIGGMYSGGMYPGGGYGNGFYDPDPNSLYAYMGDYPYGYGYGDPYGYGYGGAYDDGGMDPMMMYYMMNGGF